MNQANLMLAGLLLLLSTSLFSATFFVSNHGNDGNNGQSLPDAFLTLQRAAEVVSAGDTVLVANGIYAGFDVNQKRGTAHAPIVFKALGNEVLIRYSSLKFNRNTYSQKPDYVVMEGFNANPLNQRSNGPNDLTEENKPYVEVATNPVSGKWTIEGNIGAHEIRIIDFKRTVVHFQEGKTLPTTLSIDHLPNGRYTLMVKDKESRLLRLEKIAKE